MSHIIKITPPGVKGSSLHSLEKALEKVQKLDQAGKLKEEVTILCAGGTYPVRKTCVITGNLSVPLTIRSAPGEKAVFDGGYYITDWEQTRLNGKMWRIFPCSTWNPVFSSLIIPRRGSTASVWNCFPGIP